jgi:hypothetical protein
MLKAAEKGPPCPLDSEVAARTIPRPTERRVSTPTWPVSATIRARALTRRQSLSREREGGRPLGGHCRIFDR